MRRERPLITINGSHGEGGGALFRTALAMAALTQQDVRVHHIRGGTRKPGLTSEDLTVLTALETICEATIENGNLDSAEVTFRPQRAPQPFRGSLSVDAFEKGSVPGNALMIAESLIPVLMRAGAFSQFVVHAETYNPKTLTFDTFAEATRLLHQKQGVGVEAMQQYGGYGYAGYGEVHFEVEPSAPNGFEWLTKGSLRDIRCIIAHSGIHEDILDRATAKVKEIAEQKGYEIETIYNGVNSRMPGIHITFIARYERGLGTGSATGARGLRMESVVQQAWMQLESFLRSPATLDQHLADQALLIASFASGATSFVTEQVTSRLMTMAWVIKQFMPISLTIHGQIGESAMVAIQPG